jgi:hypothetical protein
MNTSPLFQRARCHRAAASALAGVAAFTVGGIVLAPGAGASGLTPALKSAGGGASSSTFLGGFQAVPTAGLASASATFTIPKITCTPAQDTNGAALFSGVFTDSLDVYALVTAQCSAGGPQYGFNFSTPSGGFVESGAKAGDVVVTSLFESPTGAQAEIHDMTQSVYWVSGTPGAITDTRVDIGTYNEASIGLPLANFGKATYTNVTVNGDYLGFDAPTKFNAINGGDQLVKTGSIKTTASGSTFTATFKKSS